MLSFCVTVFCVINLFFSVCVGQDEPKPLACIIGAGYSGLGTAKYMKQYGVNFRVFEATRHLGGTWRFDPHVGTDEDGLPLFTSMYKKLRTNTPRQTMEYTGFPFPEGTPSYPTGECFYKYLKHFAKTFGLQDYISFRSLVQSVKWSGNHWALTFLHTDTREEETVKCDYVVVATGYYSKPKWPAFEGQQSFQGKMLHSHDYKDPEDYRNQTVLIVGAGPSGLDLATHLSNVTFKLIHSHHMKYNQPHFSDSYVKKPDIKKFTTNGVQFVDDSVEDVDVVIFCTGFQFDHPFLDKSTGVTATGAFVLPLYQHMINIKHPSMVFVGIPKKVINKVLDVQGEYAARLAAGKIKLPSVPSMLRNWLELVDQLKVKKQKILEINTIGSAMDQYFANMTRDGGVTRAPPVLSKIRDFNAENRLQDLLNYRDYDYRLLDENSFDRHYNPREGNPCPIEV